ncbi:glycine cleavage system aminomethyltransferase GcvT [bacterium]|nr:glycine cleavage system aminomethyltransferase GcvT [bacterium]
MSNELLRTPLYDLHCAEGGKIVDFAGWEMPVEYSGIKNEHLTVRSRAGIFDLSHMGEFLITGSGSQKFIDNLVTNDLYRIEDGQCLYTCMCRESGAIIDDLIVYRFSEDRYWLVVNAANRDKDFAWVREHKPEDVTLEDVSLQTALIAIQGPKAQELLQPFTDLNLQNLRYYHLAEANFKDLKAVISRTGYTGEDGFEIYVAWDEAGKVWQALRSEADCLPIGLGARDTLRLEAGYSLYGHEITEETTPINTSLGWVVRFTERDFIGKEVLKAQKEAGIETAIVGLVMEGRTIPRSGYTVSADGEVIGKVTSGTFSPSLNKGVCLALVKAKYKAPGTHLQINVRSRQEGAVVERPPFIKGSIVK